MKMIASRIGPVGTVAILLCLNSLTRVGEAAEPAAAAVAGPAAPAAQPVWDLSDLYSSNVAWTEAFQHTQSAANALGTYKGTLGRDAHALYMALDAISAVNREAARLGVYASLKGDEDVRIGANQQLRQQADALGTLINEQTAWVAPEIIALGPDRIKQFQQAEPRLVSRFDYFLDNTLRGAPHTLGLESESVLAAAGDVLGQPASLHGVLADGELPSATVTLSDGTNVQLTAPMFEKYRVVHNRADRKLVFDAFWGAHKQFEGTFGQILATQVLGDEFTAKVRKFPDALAAAQFPDNIPTGVYHTLIEQVHASLPTLHRYLKLRRRLLGIDGPLGYYDSFVPMFQPAVEPSFSVEQSEQLTIAALQPLGEEYLALLRKGFAGRWMNAPPAPGKRSGGYMEGGAYDVHPYLLLNHTDEYRSLSTLAHEWGHAMHTLLADGAQPFEKSDYSTFVAETAAINNEMLLNDYMVTHAKSRDEKLFYLGEGLETIRFTYFRQVLFAEFELAIHQEIEQGRSLSGERMSQIYCGLLRSYYGEAEGLMTIDPGYCVEWSFVPHFFTPFYVYQYAISMAGAAYFSDAITRQGVPARERFLTLLRAGGSDYPYELYRRAGVDIATAAPYQALTARMNRLMDQIEALEKRN
jgi:oligoendopeptidase F